MCTKTTAVQTGSFYLPFFLFQPPHGKVLCCTMFFFSFAFLLFLCVFFFPKSKKCRLNRWRLHQKLAFEPMSFALFFFSEARRSQLLSNQKFSKAKEQEGSCVATWCIRHFGYKRQRFLENLSFVPNNVLCAALDCQGRRTSA